MKPSSFTSVLDSLSESLILFLFHSYFFSFVLILFLSLSYFALLLSPRSLPVVPSRIEKTNQVDQVAISTSLSHRKKKKIRPQERVQTKEYRGPRTREILPQTRVCTEKTAENSRILPQTPKSAENFLRGNIPPSCWPTLATSPCSPPARALS